MSTISIPDDLRDFVAEQLTAGAARDESDLAIVALRQMRDRESFDRLLSTRRPEIEAKLAEAIVQADCGELLPMDEVFDELEAECDAEIGSSGPS